MRPVIHQALFPLFDAEVRLAAGDPRTAWPDVLPQEAAARATMAPARRREFSAGRTLAREAMQALGLPPLPVPMGDDRAPIWPDGLVGSLSHCADLCAVALARTDGGILALGLDIEPAEPLPADIADAVLAPEERETLPSGAAPGVLARAVFSAKECAYKAQYPLSRTLLDFSALRIALHPAEGRFTARFTIDAPPFRSGDGLDGRIALTPHHIFTAITLRRAQLERPA